MVFRRALPASLLALLSVSASACGSSSNSGPPSNSVDGSVSDGEGGNVDGASSMPDGEAGNEDGASLSDAGGSDGAGPSSEDGAVLDGDAGCPGGVTPTVLATGQAGPTSIVSDGVNVYWTNNSPGAGAIHSVMKL